jgi:hypothetical protein
LVQEDWVGNGTCIPAYRDKKVVGVFVPRFRAPRAKEFDRPGITGCQI